MVILAAIIGKLLFGIAAAKGEIPPDNADLKLYQFLMINNLCIKHESWLHENEYRYYAKYREVLYGKRVPLDEIGVK
ncbi:hypothetical protein B0P06_005889 [Clostridium saccharoperbutylacetonicum]|uniref:hypothetical protein n=1 Tax=Clostridium saccharoperbutylacetonicum TaxID=36745 RepID=UPI001F4C37EA|nr:hypothetical protein [Clostridium saccharoperbutylacetonicum]NSB46118.1 hypothetical protein [Clostridium saccharoperbutylacetonicum]